VSSNHLADGRAVSARHALAHVSTAPGAADYISENNQRVVPRPAEGQPECDIFTLVASQQPAELGR